MDNTVDTGGEFLDWMLYPTLTGVQWGDAVRVLLPSSCSFSSWLSSQSCSVGYSGLASMLGVSSQVRRRSSLASLRRHRVAPVVVA
jgi:hypothetical protein